MNKDTQLLEEAYDKVLAEGMGVGRFSVIKTGDVLEPGIEDYDQDVTTASYDITENGEKVGELARDDYFGYVRGKLYGKDLPELSRYGSDPQAALHHFMTEVDGRYPLSLIPKKVLKILRSHFSCSHCSSMVMNHSTENFSKQTSLLPI